MPDLIPREMVECFVEAVYHQVVEEPVVGREAILEWRNPLGLRDSGLTHEPPIRQLCWG